MPVFCYTQFDLYFDLVEDKIQMIIINKFTMRKWREDVASKFEYIQKVFPNHSIKKQAAQARLTQEGYYYCTQMENLETLLFLGVEEKRAKELAKSASREFRNRRYVSPYEAGFWVLEVLPELSPRKHTILSRAMAGDIYIPKIRSTAVSK